MIRQIFSQYIIKRHNFYIHLWFSDAGVASNTIQPTPQTIPAIDPALFSTVSQGKSAYCFLRYIVSLFWVVFSDCTLRVLYIGMFTHFFQCLCSLGSPVNQDCFILSKISKFEGIFPLFLQFLFLYTAGYSGTNLQPELSRKVILDYFSSKFPCLVIMIFLIYTKLLDYPKRGTDHS